MNVKQGSARRSKMQNRAEKMRQEIWPNESVWDKQYAGFATIPKTMPHIMRIIDSQCDGKPAGRTYFALWCRTWNAPVLSIEDPRIMAYESGFDSERAESTWKNRMKKLEELGFIKSHEGVKSEYQYVLLLNPHQVIRENKNGMSIPAKFSLALKERMEEIGAKDFNKPEEVETQVTTDVNLDALKAALEKNFSTTDPNTQLEQA